MDPANKQDDDSESKSYGSSFETHDVSQPTVILNLNTLEIDKRFRSNDSGALVRTMKYGRLFSMLRLRLLHTSP